ncbi:unnamed protein product [Cylindrotheca closterium]|uniref:Uncharacterized protein n=1 Tax=Cylindrotheca closterium TaxID=2856 RepID=A0AAD2FP82_9STRA|nr:unnamed protein product [Cylindrotheca closterium]
MTMTSWTIKTFILLSQVIIVDGQFACSANPACSGLVGDCCPTPNGISLTCCEGSGVISEACVENASCNALGLTGSCCPTAEGVFLDCCSGDTPADTPMGSSADNAAPQCSAHAACSGLSGECCPTQDGVFLECCYSDVALPVAACDAYPACQAAGLTGLCCATAEGVYLECCDGMAQQATQCSAHASCSGLLGECCPTTDGVFLDCCNGGGGGGNDGSQSQTRECSANSECAALGLEGNCCPPDFGSKNLECCHGQQAVSTPSIGQLCSENSACAALGLEGTCCPTVHGVELHCCNSIASSRSLPPVNPPITIKYVTGMPISTPKPSLPSTPAPSTSSPISVSSPLTVAPPIAVTTLELSDPNSDQDGNQPAQLNKEVEDSISSVNQLVGQQSSSSLGKYRNIRQSFGVLMFVAVARLL